MLDRGRRALIEWPAPGSCWPSACEPVAGGRTNVIVRVVRQISQVSAGDAILLDEREVDPPPAGPSSVGGARFGTPVQSPMPRRSRGRRAGPRASPIRGCGVSVKPDVRPSSGAWGGGSRRQRRLARRVCVARRPAGHCRSRRASARPTRLRASSGPRPTGPAPVIGESLTSRGDREDRAANAAATRGAARRALRLNLRWCPRRSRAGGRVGTRRSDDRGRAAAAVEVGAARGLSPRIHLHIGSQLRAVDACGRAPRARPPLVATARRPISHVVSSGSLSVRRSARRLRPVRVPRGSCVLLNAIRSTAATSPGDRARRAFWLARPLALVLHVPERRGRHMLDAGMTSHRRACNDAWHGIDALTSLGRRSSGLSVGLGASRCPGPGGARDCPIAVADHLGDHRLAPLRAAIWCSSGCGASRPPSVRRTRAARPPHVMPNRTAC